MAQPMTLHISHDIQGAAASLPESIVIRRYTQDDADAIGTLLAEPLVAIPYFGVAAPSPHIDRYVREEWNIASSPSSIRLVACTPDERRIIAAASVLNGAVSYFVDPAWWGR